MNKEEAELVLAKLLSEYSEKCYNELQYLLSTQDTSEVSTKSGNKYQLEFQAVWDDKKGGNLRVIGSIDDGGIKSFAPITYDFVITSDGEFVGDETLGRIKEIEKKALSKLKDGDSD
jgi:hypothetical protein